MDHHATTPCDPRVVQAMLPYFSTCFANSSSHHPMGHGIHQVIEQARKTILSFINDENGRLIFTASGTEANNLALHGLANAYTHKGNHLICSSIEHNSILHAMKALGQKDFKVSFVKVHSNGLIDMDHLKSLLGPQTLFVSIHHVNNEVGVIEPIEQIAKCVHDAGAWLHVDAVQALGKVDIDVKKLGIDLMSMSSHKVYGPKGVGALYLNKQVHIEPMMFGGLQEFGLRPGTHNVPGIMGFAKAIEILKEEMHDELARIKVMRDEFEDRLLQNLDGLEVFVPRLMRIASNLHVCVHGVGPVFLSQCFSNLCVSAGATCVSSKSQSHVLESMGVDPQLGMSALRFGLGRGTIVSDLDKAYDEVCKVIHEKRMALKW